MAADFALARDIRSQLHSRMLSELIKDLDLIEGHSAEIPSADSQEALERVCKAFESKPFLTHLKKEDAETLERAVYVLGANGLERHIPSSILNGAEPGTSAHALQENLSFNLLVSGHLRLLAHLEAAELAPNPENLEALANALVTGEKTRPGKFSLSALDELALSEILERSGALFASHPQCQAQAEFVIKLNSLLNDANPEVLDKICVKGWLKRPDLEQAYSNLMAEVNNLNEKVNQNNYQADDLRKLSVAFARILDPKENGLGIRHIDRDSIIKIGVAACQIEDLAMLARVLEANKSFRGADTYIAREICIKGLAPRLEYEISRAKENPNESSVRQICTMIGANAPNIYHFAQFMSSGFIDVMAAFPETHEIILKAMQVIADNHQPFIIRNEKGGMVHNPRYSGILEGAKRKLADKLPALMALVTDQPTPKTT